MNKIFGISLLVLAIAIAVIPGFTSCQKSTDLASAMPCQQSAKAENVVGAPLAVVGVSMFFTRNKSSLLSLSIIGIVLGVSAILIPTGLIGTCQGGIMHCNTLMKPSLIVLGTLTVIGSLGGLTLSFRAKNE